MADADRDSDLGDDSPVSARSEGDSSGDPSGDHSCDSSDEGVGRDAPAPLHPQHHQIRQPALNHHQPSSSMSHHQPSTSNGMTHNHHHARISPRPMEIKVRNDFEALKTLHPHLSSLASLAQGAPLSTPAGVFALTGGGPPGGYPYAPPAFLAPAPPPPAQPVGSASSSSSEGSAAGWSFEEQYKQVRQLYEISDDPQRKEFLDDLFSFAQRKGAPINRLPIMAKSVLDLYELYNLVIARGGLVEVINKKLWQEIIKGLRLPSSITSAAFTLRTQYMKYLYDYECDKKNLSTRNELDAAIEGNKREGRRASGQYDANLPMPQLRGIPLSFGGARMPSLMPHTPPYLDPETEAKMREYVKVYHEYNLRVKAGLEPPDSPPPPPPILSSITSMDMTRLMQWTAYYGQNNNLELLNPQRMARRDSARYHPNVEYRLHDLNLSGEALNLSESPSTSSGRREADRTPPPPPKRRTPRPASPPTPPLTPSTSAQPPQVNGNGAAFKITTRGDAATGDQQLVVSIELNGVTYEGVLFPASENGTASTSQHRPMVS